MNIHNFFNVTTFGQEYFGGIEVFASVASWMEVLKIYIADAGEMDLQTIPSNYRDGSWFWFIGVDIFLYTLLFA